jgi:threonine synthase
VTGNGLKDVQWVLNDVVDPLVIPVDAKVAAEALGLV